MSQIDIKRAVKGNGQVHFAFIRNGIAYYDTDHYAERFAVPLDDLGSATLARDDRAMLFMRYMRKHNEQFMDLVT